MLSSLINLVAFWPLMVFAHRLPRRKFDTIIAFGDSYTDNGSLDYLYQSEFYTNNSSRYVGTSQAYAHTQSGYYRNLPKRWSNGYLWIEYLQNLTDVPHMYDFARSGATVDNSIIPRSTQDLSTQIITYSKSSFNVKDKSGTIYFLWIGLNDIHDLFLRHSSEAYTVIDEIGVVVNNNLSKLYKLGATRIVLLNMFALKELPTFYNLSLNAKTQLDNLVKQYNRNLLQSTDTLNSSELHILHYDAYTNLAGFLKQGLPESCNGGSNCKNLAWWDDLHLTTRIHLALAKSIYSELLESNWIP